MEAFKECLRVPGRRDMKEELLAVIYGVLSALTVTLFETLLSSAFPRARAGLAAGAEGRIDGAAEEPRGRSPPTPARCAAGKEDLLRRVRLDPKPPLCRCLLIYKLSLVPRSCPGGSAALGWGRCPATVGMWLSSFMRIGESPDIAHLPFWP